MGKRLELSTGSVDVQIGNDRGIYWCSDWSALVLASIRGEKGLYRLCYGPATYNHTSIFLPAAVADRLPDVQVEF